jgi:zinc protease
MKSMKNNYLLSLLLCVFAVFSYAQDLSQIPLDPAVRYGQLDNGLTYYISQNALPEERGEFYLVQKVGSMQEEDDQSGLAHFLEHMAFSSTKHFPEKVLAGLEKYGAQLGQNMNAYTSFDQTVYYLSGIPLRTPGAIDTCLLILHDWSCAITFQDDKIDKERLVIKEEWRTRQGAYSRIMDKILPEIVKGSKYADRMVIGKMEVVENFPYQTLKDYYHRWYRPDLQGLIIVGDFDVDEVEAKVKELFGPIPKHPNPEERIYYPVPDNEEPIFVSATDPEATSVSISLYNKHDIIPVEIRNTPEGVRQSLVRRLVSSIVSNRIAEIRQKPDAPFTSAYASDGGFYVARTKDAWTASATCKEDQIRESFTVLAEETERARQHGFADSEIERVKAILLSGYESSYNNRNKQYNSARVSPYQNHFLSGWCAPGIEYDYHQINTLLPTINASDLHNYIKEIISDKKNIVITLSGPEKETISYPTKEELLTILDKVKKSDLAPYADNVSEDPLVAGLPAPGSIVKSEKGENYDETVWTLSNGMKVVIKKTPFNEDQILFSAKAFGGNSLFDDNEWLNIRYLNAVARLGGLGSFNSIDLSKKLAGKNANVSGYIEKYTQSISGSSSLKDAETLFQLAYLNFTSPRKDEDAFAAYKEREKTNLQNRESNPSAIFGDSLNNTIYGKTLRNKSVEMSDLENIDYDRILEMYKQSFANPGSFVVTLIGSMDEKAMEPLVIKYLASLPSGNKDATYKESDIKIRKGNIKNRFRQKMETPKATSFVLFSGNLPREANTFMQCEALNKLMQMIFMRTIRGDEGGAYSVGAHITSERIPYGDVMLSINFTTDPDRVDELNAIVHRELNNLAENGPLDDEYKKAVEGVLKDRQGWQVANGFWRAVLDIYYQYGEEENLDYENRVKSITKEQLQTMVKDLLKQENVIEVVMLPEKE